MNNDTAFDIAYASLNAEQRMAVNTIYGPVMVVAGPGTGKTQIIALRAANILRSTDARGENILITTFTEAGVTSIKNRLAHIVGADAYRIWVGTFHSFCRMVIERYPEQFADVRLSRQIDDIEGYEIMEDILSSASAPLLSPPADPYRYVGKILSSIARLKQENHDPERFRRVITLQAQEYANTLADIKPTLKKYEKTKADQEKHLQKLDELAQIYDAYEAYLREKGLYDYGDIIRFVARALETEESLAANLREQYQYLMVDEYQDTNSLQNDVVNTLARYADETNLLVVGDDDQSIYRFQGANLENILEFSRTLYRDARIIVLSKNYRSHQDILDVASLAIAANEGRITRIDPSIEKPLHSYANIASVDIRLRSTATDIEEKILVAHEIRTLLDARIPGEEIAVIVRNNRELGEWTRFLQDQHITVESRVETNIFDSPYIRIALDLFTVIADPYADDRAMLDIMRSGVFPVDGVDVLSLAHERAKMNHSRRNPVRIFDLIARDETLDSLAIRDPQAIRDMRSRIVELSQILVRTHLSDFIGIAFGMTGFVEYVQSRGKLRDLEDISTLLGSVREWNRHNPKMTLSRLLAKIRIHETYGLRLSRRAVGGSGTGVQVLTAHTAKGLEYRAVFLPGLVEGRWGKSSRQGMGEFLRLPRFILSTHIGEDELSDHNEEERRLFFVALTRAKEYLHMSSPKLENERTMIQSQFLPDIGLPTEPAPSINPETYIIRELAPAWHLAAWTADEEAYIERFLSEYRLSHSDHEKFLEHPRVFLRDVILKYPFEGNARTRFGSAYHRTLEHFYRAYKKTRHRPDAESLVESFRRELGRELLTPDEYTALLEEGMNGLRGWYEWKSADTTIPLEIEYSFYAKGIVWRDIPLTGKIDTIIEDENAKTLRLIDYKTGRTRTKNELMGNTQARDRRYLRQLVLYRLLARGDPRFSGYADIETAIEFVEGRDAKYATIVLDPDTETIEEIETEIIESWSKISSIEFWRKLLSEEAGFTLRTDDATDE